MSRRIRSGHRGGGGRRSCRVRVRDCARACWQAAFHHHGRAAVREAIAAGRHHAPGGGRRAAACGGGAQASAAAGAAHAGRCARSAGSGARPRRPRPPARQNRCSLWRWPRRPRFRRASPFPRARPRRVIRRGPGELPAGARRGLRPAEMARAPINRRQNRRSRPCRRSTRTLAAGPSPTRTRPSRPGSKGTSACASRSARRARVRGSGPVGAGAWARSRRHGGPQAPLSLLAGHRQGGKAGRLRHSVVHLPLPAAALSERLAPVSGNA